MFVPTRSAAATTKNTQGLCHPKPLRPARQHVNGRVKKKYRTPGPPPIVDAADYERISRHTWFAEGTAQNCYAVRKDRGKSIKMHREITNAPDHLVVDHIDHNGLNNRRANLRLCTFAENCRNLRSSRHKTSKYKGVYWHKGQQKWAAQITANGKRHHLGYFRSEIEAAKAYDQAAPKHHGQFAHLNLPAQPQSTQRPQREMKPRISQMTQIG